MESDIQPDEGEPPQTVEQRTSVNARLRQGSSLGRLFAAVDGDGDGDLDRDEVKELLRKEGLDSSDAHVDGIFDRYFVGCPVISG